MENKLRVLSLFSGIGAFEKALERQGVDHEIVGFSEIDKFAIESYCAIHNVSKDLCLGNVSKIENEDLPKADLISYGFPCQDISIAGLGKGIVEGETRSGLLYEAERIIDHIKPKYAIAENVKNLVSKKFKDDFEGLLQRLEGYGYNNYGKALNAKHYGIPQNRERVFIVSIRKDIDDGRFEFPEGFDNGLRLKDLLEDEVEEKYYIENDRTSILLNNLKDKEMLSGGINVSKQGKVFDGSTEVASCLLARDYKGLGNQSMTAVAEPIIVASRGRNPDNPSDRTVGSLTEQRLEPNSQGITNTLTTVQKDNLVLEPNNNPKIVQAVGDRGNHSYSVKDYAFTTPANPMSDRGQMVIEETPNELKLHTNLSGGKWDKIHELARRVYNEEGIAPTIPTCGGGNIEPKVVIREATKLGYAIATVGDSINLEQPNSKARRGRVGKEVVNTLNTGCNQATLENDYRIRKLTPKECWRLMGFSDEDYFKARVALEQEFYKGKDKSNSQMYKQAGNSIVVNVLEEIFKKL